MWMANQTVTCYTNGTESGFMILGTAVSRILLKRTCIDVATKPRAILFHFVHADSRRFISLARLSIISAKFLP